MFSILRNASYKALNAFTNLGFKSFSVTSVSNIKEIIETKVGNTLVVEGIIKPSERFPYLVKPESDITNANGKSCFMCALDLGVKHTDVLILSQFVRTDGCMLPRRITGLCSKQQKRMSALVTMAQKAGLMINMTPDYCRKDPTKRRQWKQFNTYYDETTIFQKRKPKMKGLIRNFLHLL